MGIKDIDRVLKALSQFEQGQLQNVIFTEIEYSDFPKNANFEINKIVSKSRFSKDIYCPNCKSEKFSRNGKTKDGG